jgi:CRISPR-associated protein Cmr6
MYLSLWGIDERTNARLWTAEDTGYERRGHDQRERPVRKNNKASALAAACPLTPSDQQLMKALAQRQQAIASSLPAGALMRLETTAVAPFTTGLGNEHPLENGFAFLNPYGLPYLPGSGVKGVVRQAARELASGEWGDPMGWVADETYPFGFGKELISLRLTDVLFGRETAGGDTGHVRGALTFWDVIPEIAGGRLTVEVMTAHQGHYYQNGESPHESGSPKPINFLTIPPKSKFIFHVVCDGAHLRRLAPPLAEGERWKKLLDAAFGHAFQWLGFGAKTSVGYGSFDRVGLQTGRLRTTAPAANEATWQDAALSWRAGGGGKLTILFERKRAEVTGAEAQRLLQSLSPDLMNKLRKGELRADVRVQLDGNMARPVEIITREPSGS